MALRMGALYDALVKASVSHDDAARAAEEVADYDGRIRRVEASLETIKWMVGTAITVILLNLGATLAVLYRLAGS